MNVELRSLLIEEAKELDYFFKKSSIEGKGTSQEVSDRREVRLINLIRKFFPYPYNIVKQSIIDSENNRSQSIDCLILNPCHPKTFSTEGLYSIVFADGVDAAIELKPDLNSEKEINRALIQIASVKKLKKLKYQGPSVNDILNGKDEDYKEKNKHLNRIPAFIFCNSTYVNKLKLIEKIVNHYVNNKIPRAEQFDMIIVNNEGILLNLRSKNSYCYGKQDGLFWWGIKEDTLFYFLYFLQIIPKSEMSIGPMVLPLYFKLDEMLLLYPKYEYYSSELNKKLVDLN
jgi:hypothetical protein